MKKTELIIETVGGMWLINGAKFSEITEEERESLNDFFKQYKEEKKQ